MFASIEESPFQYIPLPQNARSYNEIYMDDLKNCRQKQKIWEINSPDSVHMCGDLAAS